MHPSCHRGTIPGNREGATARCSCKATRESSSSGCRAHRAANARPTAGGRAPTARHPRAPGPPCVHLWRWTIFVTRRRGVTNLVSHEPHLGGIAATADPPRHRARWGSRARVLPAAGLARASPRRRIVRGRPSRPWPGSLRLRRSATLAVPRTTHPRSERRSPARRSCPPRRRAPRPHRDLRAPQSRTRGRHWGSARPGCPRRREGCPSRG